MLLLLTQGGSLRHGDAKFGGDVSVDKRRMIISPILRLVFSLSSLIDASDFFKVSPNPHWHALFPTSSCAATSNSTLTYCILYYIFIILL